MLELEDDKTVLEKFKYEKVVQDSIYDAFRIKALNEEAGTEDFFGFYFEIFDTPNHPLLTDYNWVYEHAETLLYYWRSDYEKRQGVEEKLTLFRALVDKYPIEDDYLMYLNEALDLSSIERYGIRRKWETYIEYLFAFVCSVSLRDEASIDVTKELLSRNEVFGYFMKCRCFLDFEAVEHAGMFAIEKFFEIPEYLRYCKDPVHLLFLLRKHPYITIPTTLMLDREVVKQISHTYVFEEFYIYSLQYYIGFQVCVSDYLEEHVRFCDEQLDTLNDGILPCFQKDYEKEEEFYTLQDIARWFPDKKAIAEKTFNKLQTDTVSKNVIYREFSRHMLIALFISRHFQSEPRTLFEEIKMLYEFACTNNLNLRGMEVYEFIVSFESKSQQEIIDMYNRCKSIPIMEFFYDDWRAAKRIFIDELNEKIFNPENMDPMFEIEGVKCFDISGTKEPIIVHNTSIRIEDDIQITAMIENAKSGKKHYISMSVQDVNHQVFFQDNSAVRRKTIKFAYGNLSVDRVGIIYHKDAYSIDVEEFHPEGSCKRLLYTLESFMKMTNFEFYNEITYAIDGTPFLPIGVICEDEITKTEVQIAKELNIPILYRQKNKQDDNQYKKTLSVS